MDVFLRARSDKAFPVGHETFVRTRCDAPCRSGSNANRRGTEHVEAEGLDLSHRAPPALKSGSNIGQLTDNARMACRIALAKDGVPA
jgi:hypothetical protein